MALTKKLYLVDTCSYVLQFKDPKYGALFDEWMVKGQFVLSSIVMMELYAGTHNKKAKNALDQLSNHLKAAGLLVTPDDRDYQRAGILLKSYSRRKGHVQISSHFRDILIALSALHMDTTLITENVRDFMRWQKEIKRNFQKDLVVKSCVDLLHIVREEDAH